MGELITLPTHPKKHPANPSAHVSYDGPQGPIIIFSVNIGPKVAIQPWIPTPLTDLSLIHKAVNESDPNSPYFKQFLWKWARHLQTYCDWYHLMRGVLEPAVFLSWHSAYDDQSESRAHVNVQYNIPVIHDMLPDNGQYVNPITGQQAYFQKVSGLVFEALKMCTLWDPAAYFCNLVQQPETLFQDFPAYLNEAVDWRVDAGATREMLNSSLGMA